MEKLQLLLTDPCTKQWEDLKPATSGRYCDHCEKNIVDLTGKSDAELVRFFKNKKDNVCGRLFADQLNRQLIISSPVKTSWHWFLLPLAIGAIAISPTQATQLRPLVSHDDFGGNPQTKLQKTLVKEFVGIDTIRGVVKNTRTHEPLGGVKIKKKGFENVLAISDTNGKFEILIKETDLPTPFVFELPGFSKLEMELTQGLVVRMSERAIILGGISTISSNREPLYWVYAGKKGCEVSSARLNEINPDWIEKLEILTNANATALYGAKASNGVVLIEISKKYARHFDFSKK